MGTFESSEKRLVVTAEWEAQCNVDARPGGCIAPENKWCLPRPGGVGQTSRRARGRAEILVLRGAPIVVTRFNLPTHSSGDDR